MINRVYGIRNYKLLEFSWYITTVKFCSVLLEEHPKTENQKLKKKKLYKRGAKYLNIGTKRSKKF